MIVSLFHSISRFLSLTSISTWGFLHYVMALPMGISHPISGSCQPDKLPTSILTGGLHFFIFIHFWNHKDEEVYEWKWMNMKKWMKKWMKNHKKWNWDSPLWPRNHPKIPPKIPPNPSHWVVHPTWWFIPLKSPGLVHPPKRFVGKVHHQVETSRTQDRHNYRWYIELVISWDL